MVKDGSHGEPNAGPDTTNKAHISPVGMIGNQLTPKDRWAERQDGENEDGDVLSSLASGSKFGGCSKCRQFVNSSTYTRQGHTSCYSVSGNDRI
jgi:hypothetical protein